MSDIKSKESIEIKLEAECEFRVEVENKNETVYLKLLSGKAEIFGTELIIDRPYRFTTGAKIAVFTWHGCVLQFIGNKSNTNYVAKETPMASYLNVHCSLEQLRQNAEHNHTRGPITMIAGPADIGKSTLCKILLNYAIRSSDRRSIFVDVDVSGGHISVPGTIGAMVVEHPVIVDDGFLNSAPLIYNYGHVDINENPVLYDLLISKLADVVFGRMNNSRRVNASGIIINTFGWTKGKGYQHLCHIARAFEVDIILVLDQERLYNDFIRDLPPFLKILLLPKSGGVVARNRNTRYEYRDMMIRQYFYGTLKLPFYPHTFDVKFSDVKIVKVGSPLLPDSCLPVGVKGDDCFTKVTNVQPGPNLLHHLLAVSFATTIDDEFLGTNVAGFICVTNVDIDKQLLTVLSPQKKPLPDGYLLLSDIQYVDNN